MTSSLNVQGGPVSTLLSRFRTTRLYIVAMLDGSSPAPHHEAVKAPSPYAAHKRVNLAPLLQSTRTLLCETDAWRLSKKQEAMKRACRPKYWHSVRVVCSSTQW